MLDLYYLLAISSNVLLSSDRPMAQHIILGPYPHNNNTPTNIELDIGFVIWFQSFLELDKAASPLYMLIMLFRFLNLWFHLDTAYFIESWKLKTKNTVVK